ncbi:unnamed protein product, partial [Rotaria magnacalcarata]
IKYLSVGVRSTPIPSDRSVDVSISGCRIH